MPNRNDPARKGEAVDCFRGGCDHGHNIGALRVQALSRRFHLQPGRAHLVAMLAWGERP